MGKRITGLQQGQRADSRARKIISKVWQAWFNLLLPEQCRGCGAPSGPTGLPLCEYCLGQLRYLNHGVCRLCGAVSPSSLATDMLCAHCIRTPPPWDKAGSIVVYDSPVSTLLHRLKYQGDTTVLPALELIIQKYQNSWYNDAEIFLPVPMHKLRLQQRGLNHAVTLARLLCTGPEQRVLPTLLLRKKDTLPQTGLNGRERRRNLRGAFTLHHGGEVCGRSVCLVDDVYTTGTTLRECSKLIRQAGASKITAVTIARVEIAGI